MAVLVIGAVSAQASAASVSVNLSSAGVNVVVHDVDKKDHHQKKMKKNHMHWDKRHADAMKHKKQNHRMAAHRVDQRGRKLGKNKR